MKKRLLPLILALLMASSSFAMYSCGENEVNSTETETSASTSEVAGTESVEATETEPVNERLLIDDELPEVDYDGRAFRVLTTDTLGGYDYIDEIIAEELTGDACNDAIYNRNGRIEERFGVKIECDVNSAPYTEVITIATAGTTDYQIVGLEDWRIDDPITSGALYNWCEMPYVNLDKPWHNSLANDDATIYGVLYGICSDLSTSSMTFTHAIYVNTEMLADFGYSLDDLYSKVREGTWTFDTFTSMVESMYKDYNGDGLSDFSDIYGFGYCVLNPCDVWFTALGGKMININGDADIELTYMNEQTVDVYEAVYNLHYSNPGYIKLTEQYDEEIYFLNEKLVMAPMRFLAAFNSLRDMEATYTMIPYPKWNEAQEAYYTNADDKFSLFCVPLSVAGDKEFISIIFEALAAESYKTVYPIYYDTALKGKYSSDPTTAEMVDLIMNGRAFEFSFQFSDLFSRLPYFFRDLLNDQNPNISSKYKSLSKAVIKNVQKVIPKLYGAE